jgi:hypothetical protein
LLVGLLKVTGRPKYLKEAHEEEAANPKHQVSLAPMITSQMMSPLPHCRNETLREILMSTLQLKNLARNFRSPFAGSEGSLGTTLVIWYHPSIRSLVTYTMAPRPGYPHGYRCGSILLGASSLRCQEKGVLESRVQ